MNYLSYEKEKLNDLGLKRDLSDWNCYEVLNVPGTIYTKNQIWKIITINKKIIVYFCAFVLYYLIYSGLIFIQNPFTPAGQKYWMKRCIVDYTKKPNRLNIDAHNFLESGEEWWTSVNKLVVN